MSVFNISLLHINARVYQYLKDTSLEKLFLYLLPLITIFGVETWTENIGEVHLNEESSI